ncbi:MAG: response regulator transcription factor [Gemmatimonadaceae bacterium]|nr:response regulator transcription factor [Chitinophagaceae bacterium]
MIKVYIVEDHAVVIEGIYSLLQKEKEVEICGYATSAENCLNYFKSNTADVILMDISLPDMNGVDLCSLIKKNYPGIMVLALSSFNQGTYIRKMMESGASGYLLKNASKQEIVEGIKVVNTGQTYLAFNAGMALKSATLLQNSLPPLTKREKEILKLIASGLTNVQISKELFISIDTVDSHRKNLHLKLNVKNTAMLIRFAVENDLV